MAKQDMTMIHVHKNNDHRTFSPKDMRDSTSHSRLCSKTTTRRVVEVSIVAVLIFVVWSLCSIPPVFSYTSRQNEDKSEASSRQCSPQLYTGQICYEVLLNRQQCIPGRENSTNISIQSEIPSGLSQETLEALLLGGSSQQNLGQCQVMIGSLLCLHGFTPCDEDGRLHSPSKEECVVLRDVLCVQEWTELDRLMQSTLQFSLLPICEELPEVSATALCQARNVTGAANLTSNTTQQNTSGHPDIHPQTNATDSTISPSVANLTCAADFYFDPATGYCKPICGQWKPYSDGVVIAVKVLIIFASVTGIVIGVAAVLLSVLKYRKVWKFPSIIPLYLSLEIDVFLLLYLIGYMDQAGLLCPSQDYIESSMTLWTGYCVVLGISVIYLTWQGQIFFMSLIAVVLWQVSFPLQVKYYQASGHFRLLHIAIVVLAILLPIGPTVAMLATGGYTPFYYPFTCVPVNTGMDFYVIQLPDSIFAAIKLTLLILIFWVLVRNRWRDIVKVITMKEERSDRSKSFIPTTTLIKILTTFLCYTITNIIFQASNVSLLHSQVEYTKELRDYFICESSGVDPNKVCKRSFESLHSPLPFTVAVILLAILYQLAILLYVINLRNFCSSVRHTMQDIFTNFK